MIRSDSPHARAVRMNAEPSTSIIRLPVTRAMIATDEIASAATGKTR